MLTVTHLFYLAAKVLKKKLSRAEKEEKQTVFSGVAAGRREMWKPHQERTSSAEFFEIFLTLFRAILKSEEFSIANFKKK